MSTDVGALIATLENAFDTVAPGAVSLHQGELLDDYVPLEDASAHAAARAKDPETRWRDVPDATLEAAWQGFAHLDPAGWRFYLPALLRWGLRHPDSDLMVAQVAVYSLVLARSRDGADLVERLDQFGAGAMLQEQFEQAGAGDWRQAMRDMDLDFERRFQFQLDRFALLDEPQVAAVAAVLQWYVDAGDDESPRALERFWALSRDERLAILASRA